MKRRYQYVTRCMIFIALLWVVACTNPNEPSEGSRKATDAIIGFVLALNSQTCESFAENRVVNLTQGVSSGPHSEGTCFVVSVSAPTTIQVTTSGTSEAFIESYSESIVQSSSVSTDDPSANIVAAGTGLKFFVPGVTAGNSYTVVVN